jgi:hypothetical protein
VSALLPPGYESLEPFAERWAVSGTAARDAVRGASTAEEREALYASAKDRVADALAELDRKPLGELDEREQRLLNLLLSFAQVTLAVEMMGDVESSHAEFRKVMRITRSPADV